MFDLIDVHFGSEKTTARPYEFDQDDQGNLIKATKAITSCPNCGHGNDVDLTIFFEGEEIIIKCNECGFGYFKEWEANDDIPLNANSSYVNVDYSDIEKDILSVLNEENTEEDVKKDNKSKIIKNDYSGNITIDESNDIQTLKSDCPFIDPIEMGTFVIDEI